MSLRTFTRRTRTTGFNAYSDFSFENHERKMNRMRKTFFVMFGLVATIIVTAAGFLFFYNMAPASAHNNCVVTDKAMSVTDGESTYLVATENCGMFAVGANPFKGVLNPATIYTGIEEGGTYNFETFGFSIAGTDVTESISAVQRVK